MTDTDTAAAAELTRLGEAYFAAQHRYDPYNATLLGVAEFDGLSFDPSREASERAAQELAAIGRQASEIDPAGLTDAERVDQRVLTALVEGARADAEHSLWAANASAKSYVSRQGLIFQAVPAMTVASPEAAERYLSRLSKIGATLDALGQRYLAEAADGRTPTAVGVDHSIRQLAGYLALPVADDALLKPARRRPSQPSLRRRPPPTSPRPSGRPCSGWPSCSAANWPRSPGRTTGSASARSPAARRATWPPSRGTPPPRSRRGRSTRSGWRNSTSWPACGRRSGSRRSARATSPPSPRGCATTRRCASAPARRSSRSPRTPSTGPRPSATPTSRTTTSPAASSRRSTRSTRTTPRWRTTGRRPSTAAVPARTAC